MPRLAATSARPPTTLWGRAPPPTRPVSTAATIRVHAWNHVHASPATVCMQACNRVGIGQANLDLLHVIAYALLMRRRNPGTPMPPETQAVQAAAPCMQTATPCFAGTLLSLENPAAKLSCHPLMALAEMPVSQAASVPPHVHAHAHVHVHVHVMCMCMHMCMCMCRASRSAFVCVRAGWAGSAARVRQLLRLRRRRRPASSQGHAPVGGRGDGACRSNSACNPTYPSCNPMQ